jgi:wyosine [tRNA(Phe)-imidazoG37] synthetase (radical SAM superfamily)
VAVFAPTYTLGKSTDSPFKFGYRTTVKPPLLTTTNHSRDSAGLTYIYPVISRRSGGLSIGINLNPNNACNWRCIYCQVAELQRGGAPTTDLVLLETELRGFLDDVMRGDFYHRFGMPTEQQTIRDIALSGNGEPTSSAAFDRVIELIGMVCREYGLPGKIKLVLITNGSLARRETVQKGLARWGELGGEVWFKLDSATESGIQSINGVHHMPETVLRNLETSARLCPTWLQTCLFALDGQAPTLEERAAYLHFLKVAQNQRLALRGVLLYGLARPSMQAEAARISALPAEWMEAFAAEIRRMGLETRLSL